MAKSTASQPAASPSQPEKPLHERLPPVDYTPMGAADPQENQANLLAAKQSPSFPHSGGLIAHALTSRADRVTLDFAQQGVAVKFDVDGVWMSVEPRDRQLGDAMLAVYKKIAGLNVGDRRNKQQGKFGVAFNGQKYTCEILSQGVPTGERVLLKLVPKKPKITNIEGCGMRDKMRQKLKEMMDNPPGFLIVSAPPGGGLTTVWNNVLGLGDRFIHDYVSVEDKAAPEDDVINVNPFRYSRADGETPGSILPRLLLKQHEVFAVPDFVDGASLGDYCEQVIAERRSLIGRAPAKSAVEAVFRLMQLKPPMDKFTKALTAAVNMRVCRRLCSSCKQSFQPPPALLQKLGIPPGRVQVLYQEFKPPPPEQCVDEKGRPIQIPVCQTCNGIGYHGRVGIFELLIVDDKIREALLKQPNPDYVRQVAKAAGNRSLQEEGVLLVAQGATSIQELQRALSA